MQTNFTLAQLADAGTAEAEKILRSCVHCGFCTATCPTYVLLGDELDSPRGRIYLIKEMLEKGIAASQPVVTHLDRCLSCLSCMSTCPSGVHYMHLIDHARHHVEQTFRRSWHDLWLRRLLAWLLPHPGRFRAALVLAWLLRPLRKLVPGRLGALLSLTPRALPSPSALDRAQSFAALGERRARVALLTGCAQQVLAPQINEASIRLLTRHGIEVVVAKGMGCCGALVHHLGKSEAALSAARANITAWQSARPLDAIVINASGCGTQVKDYGYLLRDDPQWASAAAEISAKSKDISEFLATVPLMTINPQGITVTYHAACSLQHGQQIKGPPEQLLRLAGFSVVPVADGHLCCGSAGTYNILQPKLAAQLKARKLANLRASGGDLVATGNIGCIQQLSGQGLPVVHTVELLDWATGGPLPVGLRGSEIATKQLPKAATTGRL